MQTYPSSLFAGAGGAVKDRLSLTGPFVLPEPRIMAEKMFTRPVCIKIYQAYPRKSARPQALKAICSALNKLSAAGISEPVEHLIKLVRAYAASPAGGPGQKQLNGTVKDFRPYPASWFNAEGYHDDQAEWLSAGNAQFADTKPTKTLTSKDMEKYKT